MSKQRKEGDWVWLKPNTGFYGESHKRIAQIMPGEPEPCFLCSDKECQEWPNLFTAPDEAGFVSSLYHVSECEMLDEPYKDQKE